MNSQEEYGAALEFIRVTEKIKCGKVEEEIKILLQIGKK